MTIKQKLQLIKLLTEYHMLCIQLINEKAALL